ncbi:MAG: hypothetical protein GWP06_01025 [Actinobacteria bacterium]|nr:hypothetical protein [Actinomycetota bacterium]
MSRKNLFLFFIAFAVFTQSEPDAFQFVDYQIEEIKARFPWKKHLE